MKWVVNNTRFENFDQLKKIDQVAEKQSKEITMAKVVDRTDSQKLYAHNENFLTSYTTPRDLAEERLISTEYKKMARDAAYATFVF